MVKGASSHSAISGHGRDLVAPKTHPSLYSGHSSHTMIKLRASFERVQESHPET